MQTMYPTHSTVEERVSVSAADRAAPVELGTLTEGGALPTWQRQRTRAARWHRGIARVLLGCLALQLFFAGLGIFAGTGFLPHAIMGSVIILSSFSLPLIAWRGRLSPSLIRRSWLLAALMVLQGLLIDAARVSTVITALHPVNAMLLVLVTFSLAF